MLRFFNGLFNTPETSETTLHQMLFNAQCKLTDPDSFGAASDYKCTLTLISQFTNKDFVNTDTGISIDKEKYLLDFYLRYYKSLHRIFLDLENQTNRFLKQQPLSDLWEEVAEQTKKQQIKLILAITASIRASFKMVHNKMPGDTALKQLNSELDSLKIDEMGQSCLKAAQYDLQSYEGLMQKDTTLTTVIQKLLELSNTIKFTNTAPMLN